MTGVDQTLLDLLAQDQAEDRAIVAGAPEYLALRARDRARRDAVISCLAQAWPVSPQGLYAAAWVLNHGETAPEVFLAHRLAVEARDLDHPPARWLSAAALDRSLMYAGQPQKYGTNIVPDGVGYRLWDIDPSTTDAERAALEVPSLAEMQTRAAAIDAPQPPLDQAPDWLQAALRRWRGADPA